MQLNLESQIEAILFWNAEPVSIKKLSTILNKTEEEIKSAIIELRKSLENRGITVIESDNEFALGTSKLASGLI